jgi:hypothetical protein
VNQALYTLLAVGVETRQSLGVAIDFHAHRADNLLRDLFKRRIPAYLILTNYRDSTTQKSRSYRSFYCTPSNLTHLLAAITSHIMKMAFDLKSETQRVRRMQW